MILKFKKYLAQKLPHLYKRYRIVKFKFRLFLSSNTTLAPIKELPKDLYKDFTFDGIIPVLNWYIDGRVPKPVRNTNAKYKKVFRELKNKTFEYYNCDIFSFYDALDDYPLDGKDVLVLGLTGCNCDAIALWKNAKQVYVVDYNKPICEHEKVVVLSHEELFKLAREGFLCDCAFSFSSFEHDGLGRYGDPISPKADLEAMQYVKSLLKPGGLLFLGVPLGKDCLVWNAHRIYGEIRLPYLLENWLCLDVYYHKSIELFQETLGEFSNQPLMVLRNIPENDLAELEKRLDYARKLIKLKKENTKDGQILEKILKMQILHKSDSDYKP